MPKLSIIMPLYNEQDRLQRCLDSLSLQTFSDFEVIIINDNSTDASPSIVEAHIEKDSRFKMIHSQGEGAYICRNIGLENSTGQYIGFIDSDDWIKTDTYEKLISALEDNEAQSSLCSSIRFVESTGTFAEHFDFRSWPACIEMNQDYIHKINGGLCNKVYIRSHIEKACLRFAHYKMGADVLFNWKYYLSYPKVAVVSESLYVYTMRGNSIVTKKAGLRSLETINVYQEIKDLLVKSGKFDQYKISFYTIASRRLGQRMLSEKYIIPIFLLVMMFRLGISFIMFFIIESYSLFRSRRSHLF